MNDIKNILKLHTSFIVYQPVRNEVNWSKYIFPEGKEVITLPVDKDSDPFEWAEKCINQFKDKDVSIFIPGRRFDKYGTRHGKGFGWYDKFLSRMPINWIRVGFSTPIQFSAVRLKRESWDEPVDWLIVLEKSGLTVFETHARE